jgi:heme a synthase
VLATQNSAQRSYSRLVFVAFALAFIVIILGAYTRLTNAGLSCPDWPRCYGYITPPATTDQLQAASKAYPQVPVDSTKAWTEMRHRYLAGMEGLLILSIVITSWVKRRHLQRSVFLLSQSLIAIMIGQVALGMLTVTELLKPVVVLGHLLFGFSVMSILWVMWLMMKKPFSSSPHPLRCWTVLGLIILILQITLGGWISTHSAGLACVDFPYCMGKLVPPMQWNALNTDLITIHMLHRIGALITFIYIGLLSIALILNKALRGYGILLLGLLLLQITLGILNIIWLRPVDIALPHHAVAALLLLTSLAIVVRLYRRGELHG